MTPPTYPRSRQRVGALVNGPHPLTVAMVGALDRLRGLTAAGLNGGRIGNPTGSPLTSYRGDLGPLQSFRGWSGAPRTMIPMPGASMHLPMTGAPDPRTGPFR